MKEYAILGGGGMALEIADLMLSEGEKICGYYSPDENITLSSLISYLGDEKTNFSSKLYYIVASGVIPIRKKMIDFIESNNLQAGSFISKQARISSSIILGRGILISPFATVGRVISLGDYVYINAYASIAHGVRMGNNVVVNVGARITGECTIGNNVSLGANSALVPGTVLEDNVEIGILTYPPRKVKAGRFILSEPGRALR